MPVRTQGYCGVGRGLLGLHCVWCNGRGPHLEWTQEPQASSPFLTRIPWSLQSRQKRVTPNLLLRKWNFVCLSSCLQGHSPLVEMSVGPAGFLDDARGCQCPFVLCLHPQVFLQRGVLASGSFQEWTVKLGSFGMWHHPRGYVSNFLMRPASS